MNVCIKHCTGFVNQAGNQPTKAWLCATDTVSMPLRKKRWYLLGVGHEQLRNAIHDVSISRQPTSQTPPQQAQQDRSVKRNTPNPSSSPTVATFSYVCAVSRPRPCGRWVLLLPAERFPRGFAEGSSDRRPGVATVFAIVRKMDSS